MKKLIIIINVIILYHINIQAQEIDSSSLSIDTLSFEKNNSFVSGIEGALIELPSAIIFPNPIQGNIIQVKFDKYVSDGPAQIYITNLSGEIVMQGIVMIINNSAYVDIFNKKLCRGFYNILLIRGEQKVTGKFLVEE
jgi:hypothetical protein